MDFNHDTNDLCSNYTPQSRLMCVIENSFSYFSIKTYVVGTQKNRLEETVLFENPKHMFKLMIKEKITFLRLTGPTAQDERATQNSLSLFLHKNIELVHEILVFITYALNHFLSMHAQPSRGARGIHFCPK